VAQNRARRPDEEVDRKRDRPILLARHPGTQQHQVDARTDVVQSLQRLAGNSAVTAWLGQVSLQRDDAGTAVKPPTTATATATPAVDPAADARALVALSAVLIGLWAPGRDGRQLWFVRRLRSLRTQPRHRA